MYIVKTYILVRFVAFILHLDILAANLEICTSYRAARMGIPAIESMLLYFIIFPLK